MNSKSKKTRAPTFSVPNDSRISIVMQGLPSTDTKSYLETVRANFPKAEIILSTWTGTDIAFAKGLVDKVVFSDDPGGLPSAFREEVISINNLNRQIVSTVAGIKAASRPFVMKLRTDFTVNSRKVLDFWNEYPKRDKKYKLFLHRVIIPSVFSRFYSDETLTPTPFHPSDLFSFGLKKDLLLFYGSAPLATPEELCAWKYKFPQHPPYRFSQWRYAPEQAFFVHAARTKFPNIRFDDWTDLHKEELLLSKQLLLNNFIFLNPGQIGLKSRKHQYALDCADAGGWKGLILHEVFDGWYHAVLDPIKTKPAVNGSADQVHPHLFVKSAKERLAVHKARFIQPLRRFVKGLGWVLEPVVIAYYWTRSRFER